MSNKAIKFTIDGMEVKAQPGQTIMEACDAAGVYIPRLCYYADMIPGGHCRICTVNVNGRRVGSCHTPATEGMVVESETAELNEDRRRIVEFLFVSGNHECPTCEKSGDCELQALAYRLNMLAPTLTYLNPVKHIDASHPDIYIDRNRCILCGRCVRASRTLDGKSVFGFRGRGIDMELAVNSEHGLGDTEMALADKAAQVCPVGSIVVKGTAFHVPYGQRTYDKEPIGSDIEAKRPAGGKSKEKGR